jgi:hypothetical protein
LKEKEAKRTSNFGYCGAFQWVWQWVSLKFFAKLSFKKAEKKQKELQIREINFCIWKTCFRATARVAPTENPKRWDFAERATVCRGDPCGRPYGKSETTGFCGTGYRL